MSHNNASDNYEEDEDMKLDYLPDKCTTKQPTGDVDHVDVETNADFLSCYTVSLMSQAEIEANPVVFDPVEVV